MKMKEIYHFFLNQSLIGILLPFRNSKIQLEELHSLLVLCTSSNELLLLNLLTKTKDRPLHLLMLFHKRMTLGLKNFSIVINRVTALPSESKINVSCL